MLSPLSRRIGTSKKLTSYFRLPSVAHYLIVFSHEPLIIHHVRAGEDRMLTRLVREGVIALDPPGLKIALTDVYET